MTGRMVWGELECVRREEGGRRMSAVEHTGQDREGEEGILIVVRVGI
jgi:hypothetical protein